MRPLTIAVATLAALSACSTTTPEATVSFATGQAAPPAFTLGPVVDGEVLDLSLTGLPPAATVYLVASTTGTGSGACPGVLGGQCLSLLSPFFLVGNATATTMGNATIQTSLPNPVPAEEVWFQVVVLFQGRVLISPTLQRVRNDSDLDGVNDTDTDTDSDTDTDTDTDTGPLPWSSAITADGDAADWNAGATFTTSAGPGRETLISWDANNVYVGIRHPDVSSGTADNWVVVSIGDGLNGSQLGSQLNTQEPFMVRPATHILRWKADDSFTDLLTWDSGRSQYNSDADWVVNTGGAKQESNANGVVEFVIPRSALGLTDTMQVHANWVFEGAGFESSYACTPFNSFPEGVYDPDYNAVFSFDLTSDATPNTYPPVP